MVLRRYGDFGQLNAILTSDAGEEDIGVDVVGLEIINANMKKGRIRENLGSVVKLGSVRLCPSTTVQGRLFPVYIGKRVVGQLGSHLPTDDISSTNIYYNIMPSMKD